MRPPTTTAAPACPECGAALFVDTHAAIDVVIVRQAPRTMPYLERATRRAVVAFCSGCEFTKEIR